MLFDLDGTLTDSAPGILAGFRYALDSVGAPEPSPDLLAMVVGPPMIDTFRRMGLDEHRTERAVAAYFERYDGGGGWAENEMFVGIEPVLADLESRGIRLGVATSKSERLAKRIVEHFGLTHYFEFVGGSSDDLSRRAKVDVIEHTLRGLGIQPIPSGTEGVVMIGDRDHDVHGAAHWGIPTIYVGWGYGSPGENADAALTVDTVADLAEAVRV
ncbi:MAG TPA: HAD-IA family hydrolase [Aldersonia sp.]